MNLICCHYNTLTREQNDLLLLSGRHYMKLKPYGFFLRFEIKGLFAIVVKRESTNFRYQLFLHRIFLYISFLTGSY